MLFYVMLFYGRHIALHSVLCYSGYIILLYITYLLTNLLTYVLTYLFTYLLHGTESFLRS